MIPPTTSNPSAARAPAAFAIDFGGAIDAPSTSLGAAETDAERLRYADTYRASGAANELERLHVEELSRLLSQAAELRSRALVGASFVPDPSAAAGPGFELAAWRTALVDELDAAARDGARYSSSLERMVRVCAGPLATWPSARALAIAAAELHPSARARAAVAAVALREGDWVAARSGLESALAAEPPPRLRTRLQRALSDLDADLARRRATAGP